jgi:hypothetical protein
MLHAQLHLNTAITRTIDEASKRKVTVSPPLGSIGQKGNSIPMFRIQVLSDLQQKKIKILLEENHFKYILLFIFYVLQICI